MPDHQTINSALVKIIEGINQLIEVLPIEEFTIDGRLVGDIGEALVRREYKVFLCDKLVEGYDGEMPRCLVSVRNKIAWCRLTAYSDLTK
jgi:hypothetical protein